MLKEISPIDVKKMLDSSESLRFIDVRDPWEYELVKIEKAELMPLGEFNELSQQLKQEETIIIYCHHGMRSAQACQLLLEREYANVSNLKGGIDAWADEVDLSMVKY